MVRGIPMGQHGTPTAHVIVLIVPRSGGPIVRAWKGRTIRGIHKAARKRYAETHPDARISFGKGWYTYSYGAH